MPNLPALRHALGVVTLLTLANCADNNVAADAATSNLASKIGEARLELRSFTRADLVAADALAVQQGDAIAHQCFPVLIQALDGLPPVAASPPAGTEPRPGGAAVAFQTIRGVAKRSQSGLSDQIKLACAALFVDATMDVNRFVSRLMAVIASGGAAAALPF